MTIDRQFTAKVLTLEDQELVVLDVENAAPEQRHFYVTALSSSGIVLKRLKVDKRTYLAAPPEDFANHGVSHDLRHDRKEPESRRYPHGFKAGTSSYLG